jgi:gamma-glutamyltranspeptidase / glutathione hydrolase
MSSTRRTLLAFSFALLCTTTALAQVDRVTGLPHATRSTVYAQNGMAATSHPLATQIALDILRKGGSAVDAAIAANAALGLMEPTGCGIGGDLFAIVWDPATKSLYGINGSGRSPRLLTYDKLQSELKKLNSKTIPKHGMLPISVPGTVDAWFELHGRFGRLPAAEVLAPAIEYAESGFPVTELIAYYWQRSVPLLRNQPGAWLQTYTRNGRAPRKGEIFRNPDLARTYRIIAEKGRDAFYRGEIADAIDEFMRKNGGWLRKEDFVRHTSTWVDPVSVNYRGYDVYELPPNGQGIAALQMLQILEGFDLKSLGPNHPDALHLMIEAKKLAFEDRAKLYADPDFAKIPVKELLSGSYAAERRALIDPVKAAKRYDVGNPALHQGDTIYLTTADSNGMMVSLIQSNYRGMGSGVVVPGLGFGFQDRGEMFSLRKNHPNVYAPGKRPFHTIIPAFVMKDGQPWLSFGVMGGGMQPQGHVQILVNLIDFGMGLQEAGDAARWQHEGSSEPTDEVMTDGGHVFVESSVPWTTIQKLINLGHDVRYDLGGYGGYQAIMFDPKSRVYAGASESRKDGMAAGY